MPIIVWYGFTGPTISDSKFAGTGGAGERHYVFGGGQGDECGAAAGGCGGAVAGLGGGWFAGAGGCAGGQGDGAGVAAGYHGLKIRSLSIFENDGARERFNGRSLTVAALITGRAWAKENFARLEIQSYIYVVIHVGDDQSLT